MDENKSRVIFTVTNEAHYDLTEIYEHLMDGEEKEGTDKIDQLRSKLKSLKDSIIKRDEG